MKTNKRISEKHALHDPISHQPDIDNIYLYAKDPREAKYQLLINKLKGVGLKHYNDSTAFIEYWNQGRILDLNATSDFCKCCIRRQVTIWA